jgi:hypothetical protein
VTRSVRNAVRRPSIDTISVVYCVSESAFRNNVAYGSDVRAPEVPFKISAGLMSRKSCPRGSGTLSGMLIFLIRTFAGFGEWLEKHDCGS